jgi:hypothetical protein
LSETRWEEVVLQLNTHPFRKIAKTEGSQIELKFCRRGGKKRVGDFVVRNNKMVTATAAATYAHLQGNGKREGRAGETTTTGPQLFSSDVIDLFIYTPCGLKNATDIVENV